MSIKKETNRYFNSIPVTDSKEARALGSRTNWEVIEALRDVGSKGLTAKEIMKELGVSKNTVYSALKFLEAPSGYYSWVSSRRPPRHPGKKKENEKYRKIITDEDTVAKIELAGTATRIYVEEIPWGRASVDEDFAHAINPVIEKGVLELKERYAKIIEMAIEEIKKKEKVKFFPNLDERECEFCGVKHEAMEFVEAISYILHMRLSESIGDELFPKYGFGHPKQVNSAQT